MDDENFEQDSLHRCGMCGACGAEPYWSPSATRLLGHRARARILAKVEAGRRAFVAAREAAQERRYPAPISTSSAKSQAIVPHRSASGVPALPSASTVGLALTLSGAAPSSLPQLGLALPLDGTTPLPDPLISPGTAAAAALVPVPDNPVSSAASLAVSELREAVLAEFDSDIDMDYDSVPAAESDVKPSTSVEGAVVAPLGTVAQADAAWSADFENAAAGGAQTNVNEDTKANCSAEDGASDWQANFEGMSLGEDAKSAPQTPVLKSEVEPVQGNAERRDAGDNAVGKEGDRASPSVSSNRDAPSLASSPDCSALATESVPLVHGIDHCTRCEKAASRVRDLELHVQALESALKARAIQSDSMRSRGTAKGDTARLRDEVDSLRLTVDFLFRKLQKYEVSPRDRPAVH